MIDLRGQEALWGWFGLSRASFCVLPRVLMHEMPDEWQGRMAELLREYDETFDTSDLPECKVQAHDGKRFTSWPEWLLNYRHVDGAAVESLRVGRQTDGSDG